MERKWHGHVIEEVVIVHHNMTFMIVDTNIVGRHEIVANDKGMGTLTKHVKIPVYQHSFETKTKGHNTNRRNNIVVGD
jgi:hypothetical protein